MLVFENFIALTFGDQPKTLAEHAVREGLFFAGARVAVRELWLCSVAIILALSVLALLEITPLGLRIRALSADEQLAELLGVRTSSVRSVAFLVASLMAGGVGMIVILDMSVTPAMGLPLLLPAVVGSIFAGTGNFRGSLVGGFLVAAFQQIAIWAVGPEWSDSILLTILLCFLLLTHQGRYRDRLSRISRLR
jgi:branched-subunit amino acid ABC-type transport system permease component